MKKITGYLAAIVISLTAIFSMAHTAMAADEEANKKILKDAVVGAVTGATATEATKGDLKGPDKDKKHKKDKPKDGHRPPGWDKGKKVGWGGKDMPPGLAEGKEHGEGHGHHK